MRAARRKPHFPVCEAASGNPAGGFTLMELVVVLLVISVVCAITFPRLMPVLLFSRVEAEARQMVQFGRAAQAQAALMNEDYVVRVNLDDQEYYAVHWVLPETEEEKEADQEEEVDQLEKLQELRASGNLDPRAFAQFAAGEKMQQGDMQSMLGDYDHELADQQMADRFARFARAAVETRAKNVEHEGSMLDEIGPLFDPEDEFALEEEEPVEEEVGDALLQRTKLDSDVLLERIIVDGVSDTSGEVEIALSPLGFTQDAWFYFRNEEDTYYTVHWDPVMGKAKAFNGIVEPEW